MHESALNNVLWLLGWASFVWLMYRVIVLTRKHHFNSQLWGTLFESLSHYVQPLDQIKEPKQEINQVKKIPAEDGDETGELKN
jgi:hypothetical protein